MRTRRTLLLILPLMMAASAPAAGPPRDDSVMVIGALHGLHARAPAFGYDQLRAAILAFKPDVLVLEVRPDELAERKATPGRPEYPAVIWPLLDRLRVRSVAMEPGGDTFKAISDAAGTAMAEAKRRDPAGAAALSRLDAAADEVLLAYWRRAGQVQDETTAALTTGTQAAQFGLAGPAFVAAQERWDRHMTERARQTVDANPGQRILVIGSYRNRTMLERALRRAAPRRTLRAADWFDTPGRLPAPVGRPD